jgi:hypothetical protein
MSGAPAELIERLQRQRAQKEAKEAEGNGAQVAIAEDGEEGDGLPLEPDFVNDEPPKRREMERQAMPNHTPPPRHDHPPRPQRPEREQPRQPPPPPVLPPAAFYDEGDEDDDMASSGLISRGLLLDKYGLWFGAFGVVCVANSFYTTMVGVHFIYGLMFSESRAGYIVGIIAAIMLFLGQVFNSDYELPVEDEETGETVLVEQPNRKRSYLAWLTPDAVFTMVFWIVPIMKFLVYVFFGQRVVAETVRDVALMWRIAWSAPTTWFQFFVFTFFCLFLAVAIATAWGVISAYFPEKALLGPRLRDLIKERVRFQASRLQGVLRM